MRTPGMWAFMGIDPGVTSGIAWATVENFLGHDGSPGDYSRWDAHCASCDGDAMIDIMLWRISVFNSAGMSVLLSAEKFVQSNKRPGKTSDWEQTRDLVASAVNMARRAGNVTCVLRPAAEVKPWATDKRLERIGFPMAPKLKDAKDAGRHMLFGAVKSGRASDPLL